MSRYLRTVRLGSLGSDTTTASQPMAERFPLDYVNWWRRLAAPASRFTPSQVASAPAIRLVTLGDVAAATQAERQSA